jgi:hypothetical protein
LTVKRPHTSGCSPVVGLVLLVQVPHPGDVGRVAFLFRPGDRFVLSLERREDAVGVILDDVVVDGAALLAAFGPRFDVNDAHGVSFPFYRLKSLLS